MLHIYHLKIYPGDMIQMLSLHIYYPLYISTVMQTRYFCGDFNGRVGKPADIVSGLDEDIPPRTCLDEVKKGHGDVLLEFIKDGRLAILNGRINPMADNFTCVSHRRRSVVDYMLVPHDCLKFCLDFKVELMSDIIEAASCTELISNTCKMPDHSLLTVKMVYDLSWDQMTSQVDAESEGNSQNRAHRKMYYFDRNSRDFLSSPLWNDAVKSIIDKLITLNTTQENLDNVYLDFCNILFNELNKTLKLGDTTKVSRKRYKMAKPYWNEEYRNVQRKTHLYL